MPPVRLLLLLFALLVSACAGSEGAPARTPGADGGATDTPVDRVDASGGAMDSGVFTEGGALLDAGAPSGDPQTFPADPAYSADFATGESGVGGAADPASRLSCFDGVDNDRASGVDCADPTCQPLGSCCVGSGTCCSPVGMSPLPTETLDFSSCSGTDAAACLATLTGARVEAFGSPGSFLDHGALAPGGDMNGDAGFLLGDAVDLRTHSVTVDAQLLDAAGCGPTCLESVAFGFVPDAPVGRVVRPLVALLASPSLHEVRLILAGEVAQSFATSGSNTWTLTLNPEGSVSVDKDGSRLTTLPYAPAESARLVVYGRSRNPTATAQEGARLNGLSAWVELCDMPTAWGARSELSFVRGMNPAPEADVARLRAPSFAQDEGPDTTFAAFADDGDLLVAPVGVGGVDLDLAEHISPDPGQPWQAGGFDDPSLLRPTAGSPELYFTAVGEDGALRVGKASLESGLWQVDPTPALEGATFDVNDVSEPTVVDYDGTRLIVARVDDDRGARLEAFYRRPGHFDFSQITDGNLGETTSLAGAGGEIGEPSLVLFDHAWHLYVTRHVGARQVIGLLASDELAAWRWVDDAVLVGGAGFDGLGVSSPDAFVESDGVRLRYLGSDGVTARIGETHRAAGAGTYSVTGTGR